MAAEESWSLSCGSRAYAIRPRFPDGLALSDVADDALILRHFGARPDEVLGWQSLSKKGLKRAMDEVRYSKLAEERQRRKSAVASAEALLPPETRKRARPPSTDSAAVLQSGAADTPASTPCQRKSLELRAARAAWAERALAAGVRVVVDCSFVHDSYMGLREQISLTSQLSQAYGAVRKHAERPVRLVLTGVPDSMLARMGRAPGSAEWGLGLYREDYTEVFEAPADASTADAAVTGEVVEPALSNERAASDDVCGAERSGGAALVAAAGSALAVARGPVSGRVVECVALDVRQTPAWASILKRGLPAVRPTRVWRGGTAPAVAAPPAATASLGTGSTAALGASSVAARTESGAEDDEAPDNCAAEAEELEPTAAEGSSYVHAAGATASSLPDNVAAPPPPVWPECPAPLRSRLVYLTADSPHILTTLDPDDVYIVGGLIDRNRFKGITQRWVPMRRPTVACLAG